MFKARLPSNNVFSFLFMVSAFFYNIPRVLSGMDGDLSNVVIAISKNKSLRHLHMGRSMKKHMSLIMDAVVQILQDDECLLQSLMIPDCRLRSDTFNLLNALGDNKSLETLDISGNLIGDSGARLLAKALQINTKLRTIIIDRNNVTLQGYHDLAYALESNRTVSLSNNKMCKV